MLAVWEQQQKKSTKNFLRFNAINVANYDHQFECQRPYFSMMHAHRTHTHTYLSRGWCFNCAIYLWFRFISFNVQIIMCAFHVRSGLMRTSPAFNPAQNHVRISTYHQILRWILLILLDSVYLVHHSVLHVVVPKYILYKTVYASWHDAAFTRSRSFLNVFD